VAETNREEVPMRTQNDPDDDRGRTLGEAANRWVTFQMVMAAVGLVLFLFLLFLFLFFLPMWRGVTGPFTP
jgi:quinol-cytochrome oxidoreductase complex cytochrome b subunit